MAISYDSVDVLSSFSAKAELTFPVLSDEGSTIIRAFGIENVDGVPHPGTFIVDREGTVRAKLFEKGYKTRVSNAQIIAAAKGL